MKNKEQDFILDDWLEFKLFQPLEDHINIRRNFISEIQEDKQHEGISIISMSNGNSYRVKMSYEKVLELV